MSWISADTANRRLIHHEIPGGPWCNSIIEASNDNVTALQFCWYPFIQCAFTSCSCEVWCYTKITELSWLRSWAAVYISINWLVTSWHSFSLSLIDPRRVTYECTPRWICAPNRCVLGSCVCVLLHIPFYIFCKYGLCHGKSFINNKS